MHPLSLKHVRESYQSRLEPEKYIVAAEGIWTLMLITAIITIAATVGYGIFQFIAPRDTTVSESVAGGITGFNRAQLTQIVQFYEKRQAKFEGMMSGE